MSTPAFLDQPALIAAAAERLTDYTPTPGVFTHRFTRADRRVVVALTDDGAVTVQEYGPAPARHREATTTFEDVTAERLPRLLAFIAAC